MGFALSPASAGPAATVTGQVLDEQGEPAAGILVGAVTAEQMWESPASLDGEGQQVVTDADGRFAVTAPQQGGFLIRACPRGEYEGHSYCLSPEERPAHLRAYRNLTTQTTSWIAQSRLIPASAETRDIGTIQLEKPSRIRGTLTHANVEPTKPWLPSELVVLRRLDGTQVGYRFLDSEAYDFTGLAPGQYRIEAHMTQLMPVRYLSDVITVGSGETKTLDATLDRPATLVGRLTASGRGVARQQYRVFEGKRDITGGVSDASGRYSVKVPRAGTYVVRAVVDETPYLPAASPQVTVRGGETARRNLALVKGASLKLRVANATGSGINDRLRDAKGRSVRGYGADGKTITYRGLAKGRYTLTAVSGGRYLRRAVQIKALKSYDLGSAKVARATVSLTGTTLPHAFVGVGDHRDIGSERYESATPETPSATKAGRYRVNGLIPGTYRVVLRGPGGTTAAPRVVTGLKITRSVRKNLPMPTGAVVTGRLVRDATGEPIEVPLAVEAVHTGVNRRYQFEFGLNGADGRFVVDALMAGRVNVTSNVQEGAQHDYWEVGTPYFLVHDRIQPTLKLGERRDVGDVRLRLGGGPS